MSRKASDEWKSLVEQQITSGLSVPKFCDQHQLSAKYFYARKAIIAKDNNNAGFIQAQIITKQATLITQQVEYPIKLNLPVGELSFPHDISPAFIAELLGENLIFLRFTILITVILSSLELIFMSID